mmetsp:Transcript_9313/g.25755  ORF Transcript_9313/g.25755 Transcript_9313/m.25755 type:complete len:1397 (-) Transcript_9313:48-4238(-)
MATASYCDGDVVWTKYGAGVVVRHRAANEKNDETKEDVDGLSEVFVIRLWRDPGKSISSAALAYLDAASIVEKLPAAPGMTTSYKSDIERHGTAEEGIVAQLLVHSYHRNTNTFVVSDLEKTSQIQSADTDGRQMAENELAVFTVDADKLAPSPASKFYPILETLMVRGDETAEQARDFFRKEETQQFVKNAQDRIQTQFQGTQQTIEEANIGEKVEALAETVTKSVEDAAENYKPSETQIKEVLTMVKDQELTTLLENCRTRLEQLVQSEIPKATTLALQKTGIEIKVRDDEEDDDNVNVSVRATLSASIDTSRQTALASLDKLMKELDVDPSELENMKEDVAEKFSATFDSLAEAAKSDRGLNDLFESVADKTTVWQQETGRLLQTRTASLFMEGANRLKVRAEAILKSQWAGGAIGSKLTKAFTEKDAALARLKSVQLGDAVKNRLVEAIEVRSESLGGLDGIIAGALAKARTTGEQSGDKMREMLSQLQNSATGATSDARETLISVLSHRSMYRDVALLRLERVFCELDKQFGDELSPEDIAAMARGEGGTAKLFEPIAKRAVQQIEKSLDAAEGQVSDQTVLEVLKRVRKITSGELTVSALTEELIDVLNDERIVAASETFVQHGEQVLDAIEGVSSNKVVNDAMKIVEKAGITKDSVMKEIEKIDVDELLDTAGGAVTDEKKRHQLLSTATDTALDFILRILPSMPVPPFDGVRDGLVYSISNLSMEGFRVKKEDIQIQLAGIRATKKTGPDDGESSEGLMEYEEVSGSVKATELLIIDVKKISAALDDASWSFEQTYLPYLKGDGLADVKCSDGAIRLQFELRRREKSRTEDDAVEWEPVLCLHDRSCSIGEMELALQGESKLTWIVNKLASIFKGPLRDYVVSTIVNALTNRSGWILERLNNVLSPYWGLILKTAKLKMDDLAEAGEDDVVMAQPEEKTNLVELVWRERLPLGMNLLMNDESGELKVVDFPRGSQARVVSEKRQLDPDLFKGATIIAVNGTSYEEQDELFDALKDPGRPKTVSFRLAESAESERVRRFVEGTDKAIDDDDENDESNSAPRKFGERLVTFNDPGELGIIFEAALDNCGLVVNGFLEGGDGTILAAQRSNDIQLRDLLTHVNGQVVVGRTGQGRDWSLKLLEESADRRPLLLSFVRSYLYRESIVRPEEMPGVPDTGGPEEMLLKERTLEDGSRRIYIKRFNPVSGCVESSGIFIGDHLVFVNGTPVGAGARWMGEGESPSLEEVYEMLCNKAFYPIGLTFARPQSKTSSRWTSQHDETFSDFEAETICVTCSSQSQLGCILDSLDNGDIVISDFSSVPGILHSALSKYEDNDGKYHVAIDSINGQFVPSYATKDMVMNALKRSWNNDRKVEIILCDDGRKEFVNNLIIQ